MYLDFCLFIFNILGIRRLNYFVMPSINQSIKIVKMSNSHCAVKIYINYVTFTWNWRSLLKEF